MGRMRAPLTTLTETGFSQRGGEAAGVEGCWTPELIAGLDWMRLVELARALATHSGCELAGSRVLADGSVAFGMIEQPKTAHPQRALVKLAAWNEWGATAETVALFAGEVATARQTRGVLIAPGGFSPAALQVAQQHRIEVVDAAGLHAVLMALPAERSDFLFTIATAGDGSRPTCPVCLRKLERVESAGAGKTPSIRVMSEQGLVAEAVVCDLLDVAPGAELTFLYEVRAGAMRIAGHAEGDFVCEGTVTIEPGGTLDGKVAARAIQVREGGELRGQFRILEGTPESFTRGVTRWHWACRSTVQKADCSAVRFDPHGD